MNTPKLRFKEFIDEWQEKKLKDFFNYKNGNSFEDKVVPNGRYNLITLNSIDINGKIQAQHKKVDETDHSLSKSDLVMVLSDVAHGNFLGLTVIIPSDNFVLNQRMGALKPNGNANSEFIKTYINNNQKYFKLHGQGSSQLNLSKGDVENFPVTIPNINEQQKIADFLTTVDERIGKLEKKKGLFEKYKKGVMQNLFPAKGETNPKIRFRPAPNKDYPDWVEKKLGNLGKFISGQGFTDLEQGGKTGIPFYKVSDMNTSGNEERMRLANHYVTEEQIKRMKYKVINARSIIFAKVGAAIFMERKRLAQKFLIDNNMMAFIPDRGIEFIRFVFRSVRLSRFAQVGALPSYNASDLSIIKVKIPESEEEQQKIADFLTSLDNKVDLINKKLEQAKEFKKGLLQKMFV